MNYEEAEAMMEEYGYSSHDDCRALVLAAFGTGYTKTLAQLDQAQARITALVGEVNAARRVFGMTNMEQA